MVAGAKRTGLDIPTAPETGFACEWSADAALGVFPAMPRPIAFFGGGGLFIGNASSTANGEQAKEEFSARIGRYLGGVRVRLMLLVFLPWLAALTHIGIIDRRPEQQAQEDIARYLEFSISLAETEQKALARAASDFLATLDALVRATRLAPGASCDRTLAELHAEHLQFQNFGILDARGTILCAALPNPESASFAGLQFIADAVTRAEPSMSNYQIGPVTRLPQLGFAYPLRQPGKPVERVLFVTAHLDILDRVWRNARLPAGFDLIVLDRAGLVMYANPAGASFQGQPVPTNADFRARGAATDRPFPRAGLNGNEYLASAGRLSLGNGELHLSIGAPRELLAARTWEIRRENLLALALIGGVALLLTWYAAEILVLAKLRNIRGAIRLWAQGDLAARTDLAPGHGEVRQLAADLDAMAGALTSLARRHALILDAAGEGIYGLDYEGRVNFVNPAAARLLGYKAEEFLHRPITETANPQPISDDADSAPPLPLSLQFGTAATRRDAVVWYQRKDGSMLRADLVRAPVFEKGRQIGVVDVFSDRSEQFRTQQALRESEARTRAFIVAAPDAILIIDARGRIDFANEQAEILSGTRHQALVGTEIEALLGEAFVQQHLAAVSRSRPRDFELKARVDALLRRKDDSLVPVEISLAQFAVGRQSFIVAIARDVSERKEAERRLLALAATLERRVKLRTAAIERAYRELESFSYTVAHDLRAPLRAISGFSQVVQQSEGERMSPAGRELFERVVRNVKKMDELIDDILRYSRSATTRIEIRPVDMDDLVKQVIEDLREQYPHASILLAPLPGAQGDPAMLKQVWSNLIGNALKFSALRDLPRVEIGCRCDEDCVYYVADNGVGFDMAHAERLFGMFQRLHAGEQFRGTGVGLAIVRRLIERMGGQIWAQSHPGSGATFLFTLGHSAESPEHPGASPANHSEPTS
ncbi:MAG: PAS domain S-box protein [Burkholderiales bacterium]|nr:MAG: PAS domain S-box protein [Burkholderiales bacterium]